jgi:hypothetical protein
MAEAPAKTTTAPLGPSVRGAKTCFTAAESEIVQPSMATACPPTLTISTNSPAVAEPGSLAMISLRMTCAGAGAACVTVTDTSDVTVRLPAASKASVHRSWLPSASGPVSQLHE